MRRITNLIFILSLPTIGFGQTSYKDFKIENGELIYQRVFDTVVNIQNAHKYYTSQPRVKNIQVFDNYITGEFEDEVLDYRKYGRNWASTPILFINYHFSGKIKVEFKEDKYRLTVFGIKSVAINSAGSDSDLSTDATRKNRTEIRPSWATNDLLGLFNAFFTDSFAIKGLKSDW